MQVKRQTDSLLTTVYMDWQDDFVLEFNHYNNRYIGTYHFDERSGHIQVQWRYPACFKTPFRGTLERAGNKNFRFTGVLGTDSLQMQLLFVPEPK
jgi:hypothetical protein